MDRIRCTEPNRAVCSRACILHEISRLVLLGRPAFAPDKVDHGRIRPNPPDFVTPFTHCSGPSTGG